jgi:hypothetical protein
VEQPGEDPDQHEDTGERQQKVEHGSGSTFQVISLMAVNLANQLFEL